MIEAEANEDVDESELDLAWKMLDIARAIAEKQQLGDTMEKVDILSALAEVDLERGQYLTARCSLCMLCWGGGRNPLYQFLLKLPCCFLLCFFRGH